ncbi:MAG: ABC transporter ATP-binding protein [Alphaproteobacteria bacterium]|nr:ABC transporter ATP-binding protein [Alphaproteobacteria bacterium]
MSGPLFAFDQVEVRFGGLRALSGFSMEVEEGTIHALIGPNGAGKSTAFNCASRFYKPFQGDVVFQGKSLLPAKPAAIAKIGIARTFQNVELFGRMSVLENVLVGMTPQLGSYLPFAPSARRARIEREARRDAEALLEEFGLSEFRDTPAEELDFGRQKMLDVARALACKPKLLLLDEPAAGLRNREIAALDTMLVELCRNRGMTIILVEHVMQLVMSIADRITVLNFGAKIAEGTPDEIKAHPEVIEAYLGTGHA